MYYLLFYFPVCSCIQAIGDDTTLLYDSTLENIKKTDRCLRVLENVGKTFSLLKMLKLTTYNLKKKYSHISLVILYYSHI